MIKIIIVEYIISTPFPRLFPNARFSSTKMRWDECKFCTYLTITDWQNFYHPNNMYKSFDNTYNVMSGEGGNAGIYIFKGRDNEDDGSN